VTFLAGLASSSSNSTSSISNVEPGVLGFLVVAALGVALVFILRSMNRQFKKIGPRPEDPEDVAPGDMTAESDPDAGAEAATADPAAAKRR
jgi:hypothetical protein